MEKKFVTDANGHIGYLDYKYGKDKPMFHTNYYLCSIDDLSDYKPATEDEIKEFEFRATELEAAQKRREKKEKDLLSLAGLKHSDFCRFRHVLLESGLILNVGWKTSNQTSSRKSTNIIVTTRN